MALEKMTPLLLLLLLPAPSAAASSSSFSLAFFPGAGAISQLALSGGANATSGAVSMPAPRARVQYRNPIAFHFAAGFSTYFSFTLPPQKATTLAFFLAPPSPAAATRSPPVLAVVFSARHIRLDLSGRTALQTRTPSRARGRLHSWIDYNATSATLHVGLSAARLPTPPPALLSFPLVDLSPARVLQRGPVLAGFQFQASSGNCSLFSWAFHGGAPYRMHSLPLNPTDLLATPPPAEVVHGTPDPGYKYNRWGAAVSLLFAAACGAMVTFFVLFLWYSVSTRRPVAPVDVVYEKIVLVGVKGDAAAADNQDSGGNK